MGNWYTDYKSDIVFYFDYIDNSINDTNKKDLNLSNYHTQLKRTSGAQIGESEYGGRRFSEIDQEKAYEIFKKSYDEATGESFTKDSFFKRARGWTFYGDDNGYIAVRIQQSGMIKLVGMAGNFRSILNGFNELWKTNNEKPIWAMVTKDIANMSLKSMDENGKKKFFTPPVFVLKILINLIPSSVLGGATIQGFADDGGVIIQHPALQKEAIKYFIANKAYYMQLIDNDMVPSAVKIAIKALIGFFY